MDDCKAVQLNQHDWLIYIHPYLIHMDQSLECDLNMYKLKELTASKQTMGYFEINGSGSNPVHPLQEPQTRVRFPVLLWWFFQV